MRILQIILDWSEVWALFIPLAVAFKCPRQPKYMVPVVIYCVLALVIDIVIDASWYFKEDMPWWLQSNNYLYNIHSIARLICLGIFFMLLKENFFIRGRIWVLLLSLLLILVNFLFSEDFFRHDSFSSRLFAFEAGLVLFYCLQYFIYRLVNNDTWNNRRPEFWVVAGLSIYVIFNFPYFLFYTTLISANEKFAEYMWNFHNVTYIILCIFLAKALYASGNK